MSFNNPTVIMFIIYLIAMLGVGWLGYLKTRDLSDYILGGRSLGKFVTALSAGASDMSGWLLMGLPGAVYLFGISEIWIAIGLTCGAYLNWRFIAARLRLYTEKANNALTLPDYLAARFEDHNHILRITCALVILIFFTLYCSSGVVAGARLFESMFNLPYSTAIWVGAICTIAYVFIGGFLAVSWTDTIQASLMITALILVPIVTWFALQNSLAPNQNWQSLVAPNHFDLFKGTSVIGIISLLAWGLGYFGQPHILVRFMAADNVKTIAPARRISISWMIFCLSGTCCVGFLGTPYFASNLGQASIVNANSEAVFMELAKHLFNPWLTGLLLAAVLAAVMSTLSCQLLVCSSALTEDIYRIFFRKNAHEKELVWVGRSMVLLVALIAILLAVNPNSKVLSMVSYAWAGFGASFGPIIILSLFWQKMTREGAIAGIITGAITVLVWKQFNWFSLYEIVPGFTFASTAIIGVSLLNKPSKSMLKYFKNAEEEFNKLK